MNGFDLSTISGLYIGSNEYTSIYKGSTLIWTKSGPTPIDYSREYFTIQSLEDNNIIYFKANDSSLLITIQVSTDKTNWISYTSSTSGTYLRLLNTGQKLYVRGTNDYYATSTVYNYFTSTGTFNVYGNIMSLCYGDNFVNQTALPGTYTFYRLFRNCTKLVDISNLILPATTLTYYCYGNMFESCSSLTSAPELPATTLAIRCYSYMFRDCTSLTSAPELPATTLANYCYYAMFYNCTSLTSAPELPATTLTQSCYGWMFSSCTSLTTAPELPATTLADYCYYNMFRGCTSLTTAPSILPATTSPVCSYGWMFYGCTSLTTAPELPATTLTQSCYEQMFYGCTSLTTAPELPATTLVYNCYRSMFQNCTSLNYVKALFTTNIITADYTSYWLYNVASTGTFVKNKNATWSRTDASGIPSGWRVITI